MLGLWRRDGVKPAASAAGGGEIAFPVENPAEVDATFAEWRGRGVRIALDADSDGFRLQLRRPRSRRPAPARLRAVAGLSGPAGGVAGEFLAGEAEISDILFQKSEVVLSCFRRPTSAPARAKAKGREDLFAAGRQRKPLKSLDPAKESKEIDAFSLEFLGSPLAILGSAWVNLAAAWRGVSLPLGRQSPSNSAVDR